MRRETPEPEPETDDKAEQERRAEESPPAVQEWMEQIEKEIPDVGDGEPLPPQEDERGK